MKMQKGHFNIAIKWVQTKDGRIKKGNIFFITKIHN